MFTPDALPAATLELTDQKLFFDLANGGAWPFLVSGTFCLINSDNERDSNDACLKGGLLPSA